PARPAAPATAGIATALITGERAGVADSDYAALRDSGLAHLLAISGLHLTMVAGGAFWTLRLLLALFEGPALAWPTKKLAAAGGLIVTGAYLALSGAPVSAVRASLMLAVMFTAILLDRPAITLRLVSLAALVILALYPESLLEAGFQMSFAAVVALVAVYEHYRSWTVRFTPSGHLPLALRVLKIAGIYLLANMATSLVAGLATSPFSAFHFHRVSNYELIANLAAVPVMANLVMPAGLLGVILMPLGLEAGPLGVMAFGIETILGVGHGVSALPGAVTLVPAGPGPALGALCLGGLLIALTRGHLRWAGLAPIALGLVLWAGTPRPILLVDGDGETVALRAGDGGFAIVSGRTEGFSTERWIEREGLSEPSRSRQGLLTCDGWGCIGEAGGHGVALVEDGRALADDCRWAEIVIARIVVRDCPSARIVIDRFALWDGGAHAIWRKGEDLVVRSVAETRGQRPWSGAQ
ncbi:MAG: ComEC/Rec2 family competence protein, partial [Alphaproteobacteria bacterium]|nr:ComEC/Rec2 family competence protein [Alphaproteobacteria bacterium]